MCLMVDIYNLVRIHMFERICKYANMILKEMIFCTPVNVSNNNSKTRIQVYVGMPLFITKLPYYESISQVFQEYAK